MHKSEVQIVGIGSWQANDIAGWCAVKILQEKWIALSRDLQMPGAGYMEPVFHLASSPSDLLDWMRADQAMYVVDACSCEPADPIECNIPQRFRVLVDSNQLRLIPETSAHTLASENDASRNSGPQKRSAASVGFAFAMADTSHNLELSQVLELAECLGRLPKQMILWTIPVVVDSVQHPQPSIPPQASFIDPEAMSGHVECVVQALFDELRWLAAEKTGCVGR